MAKFKPAKGKRSAAAPKARGAVPCIVFLLSAMALLLLLFYYMVSAK